MVRLLLGLRDYVVHVNLEHVSDLSSDDLVHHSLVGSVDTLQAERYYVIVIVSQLGHEGRILLVALGRGDLVVPKICIHKRQQFKSIRIIN